MGGGGGRRRQDNKEEEGSYLGSKKASPPPRQTPPKSRGITGAAARRAVVKHREFARSVVLPSNVNPFQHGTLTGSYTHVVSLTEREPCHPSPFGISGGTHARDRTACKRHRATRIQRTHTIRFRRVASQPTGANDPTHEQFARISDACPKASAGPQPRAM